jgi:hypothetical protein
MSLFGKLINEIEDAAGIDLDGDGHVGERRASTQPMPRPPQHKVEQQAQRAGRQPRHRALFIGINYLGSSAELHGCINDVRTLQKLLNHLHFPLNEMKTLTEDPSVPGYVAPPTKANILRELHWLVEGAVAGDTLFLHFSGHGTSVEDRNGDEEDGKDEALVPVDYQKAGVIVDDDIFATVVGRLPDGVRLTAVLDCCHSGTLMDLPFLFTANADNLTAGKVMSRRREKRKHQRRELFTHAQNVSRAADMRGPDVIMFSGCHDHQTSADVSNVKSFDVPIDPHYPGAAGGACTNALAEMLYNNSSLRFVQLLQGMRENLEQRGFSQIPQMSSTKPVNLNAVFSFWGDFD